MKLMKIFPLEGIEPLFIGIFMAKIDDGNFAKLKKTLQ